MDFDAFTLDGRGNITKSMYIRWHVPHSVNGNRGASYVPSPIAANRHFFVVSDVGYLSCLETQTGKRLWMKKLGSHHTASPVLGGGHLYFVDDNGVTYVLKASDKFEVLHRNKLGEECYASPAISHSQIFFRGLHNLYCIGTDAKKAGR
jgi:outer membrane protein assembly factor BamB